MGVKELIHEPLDEKKGGIALGIILVLLVIPALGYGRAWAFAGGLRWMDYKILEAAGAYSLLSNSFWSLIKAPMLVFIFLVAFVVGSFIAAKINGEFVNTWDKSTIHYQIIGGFLMGVGIVLITTCNIGIFLNSMPQLSIGGYIAAVGLVIGTYIGAKIYERTM